MLVERGHLERLKHGEAIGAREGGSFAGEIAFWLCYNLGTDSLDRCLLGAACQLKRGDSDGNTVANPFWRGWFGLLFLRHIQQKFAIGLREDAVIAVSAAPW